MYKRVLIRLVTLMLAIGAAGLVSVAVAQPALAACNYSGHVYFVGSGVHLRWETDPVDGQFDVVRSGSTGFFDLGGNGLSPGTTPTWDIYDGGTGAYVRTFVGSKTGSNCVSNQRTFSVTLGSGGFLLFRSNYVAGNSGRSVSQQNLVSVVANF